MVPMHHGLDEELLFSRMDRRRQAKDAKVVRLREKLLLQKDIGYTEALERDSLRWLASLLYKSPETFEQRIVLILARRVQSLEEIRDILG
ncbi:UNVERIFIED_CONTAM: hypothetical protein PYX00_011848 [Menopon gallinae]|uniref:Uncharacterized protein n=1 Tax=Menopon gallinae TaxID=328185 RepID=A0AAW2H8M9_9NEOP